MPVLFFFFYTCLSGYQYLCSLVAVSANNSNKHSFLCKLFVTPDRLADALGAVKSSVIYCQTREFDFTMWLHVALVMQADSHQKCHQLVPVSLYIFMFNSEFIYEKTV